MTFDERLASVRAEVATTPLDALTHAEALVAETTGRERAYAEQLRARALRALARHEEALAAFAAATMAAVAMGDSLLAAQVEVGAVDTLGMLGRYNEATTLAITLGERLQELGAVVDAAKVLGNLGNLHLRCDAYTDAIIVYSEAEALLVGCDEPMIEAGLAINRAIALSYLGRSEEALAGYQKAQAIYQARSLVFEAAVAGANIGFLHHTAGQHAVALAELTAAYTVFAVSNRPHEAARCDLDTGDTYAALNLLPEAQSCYERALSVFVQHPLDDDRARALLGIASVAAALGQPEGVRVALRQAEAHFESQGNKVLLAHTWLQRAALALRLGEPVVEELAWAREVFLSAELFGWAAEAQLLEVLSAPTDAPEPLIEIAQTARAAHRGWLECRAERALGALYVRRGERVEALAALRRAVSALEAIRTQIAPEELHLAFLSDKEAIYGELVMLLLGEESPTEAELLEALMVVEQSRSRLLLERLLAARPEVQTLASGPLDALRSQLSRAYRETLAREPDEARRPSPSATPEALAALEAEYARALREAELKGTIPETTLQYTLPELAALQNSLTVRETLLLYVALGEWLAAFIVTPTALTLQPRVARLKDVAHVARRFRYHLQKPPSLPSAVCELDAVLETLHKLLIAPLGQLLGERLVVVPAGPLHGLPFHALKSGESYLLDHYEIVYAPSASVWHALSNNIEREIDSKMSALLVGVPGVGTEKVASELEAIAQEVSATVLCGEFATLERVRREMERASMVHLATHALFRHDNPLFSGLQLADDWLLGRDLYTMKLSADLVTLSACDTGATRIAAGEEWMGLARGFLTAGARRVLVSLWPADDAATADLMGAFYRQLQRGSGPAAALRSVQQELRQSRPHPYYWAAFYLIGQR